MLITSLVLFGATTNVVWKKLTRTYQTENIQSKLGMRNELQRLGYKNDSDLENRLTELEEIFLN